MTDALQALRTRFLARALEDRAVIDRHLAGAALQPEDLRILAHRLAGAGGTFGFSQISQAAGEVEDAVLLRQDPAEALARLSTVLGQSAG